MDLSLNNNQNKQNKECHSRTIIQSKTTPQFSSTNYQIISNSQSNVYSPEIASHSLEFEKLNVGVVDTTSNIKSPDIAFSPATVPYFYSTDYQRMSNAHSNLYLSKTASHPLKFEQSNVGVVDTTSNIKSPDIAYSSATTPYFYSTDYQRMSNAQSNSYLSETASHSLEFDQSNVGAIDTTSNIKSPDIDFSPATAPYFYSTDYQRMSNAHSNLYLSKTASHPLKFEQSNVGVIDSTRNIKSPAIAYSSATTPYFYSTDYQRMSNAHSNLYLSKTASHPLKFEQSNVGAIDTTSNIKSPDIVFSPATTPYFYSTDYQRMSNTHSNLYLSKTASHPLKFEQSNVGAIDSTSNIKSPDIAFSPATTHFYSTNYQRMTNENSNLCLSETASHPLEFELSNVGVVDTTSNIKSPDIAFSPATTPYFYSTDYQRMSNAHSNLYLSKTASHPLKFEQSNVGFVDITSNIKTPDIAFSPATAPYFYSTDYQRMSNAHSNLYLSKTASHPLKFEQSNVGVIDSTRNIKSPAIAYSSATTPYFYSTDYQRMSNAQSNSYLSKTASHPLKFEQSNVGAIDTTSNIKSPAIAYSSATTPYFYSTDYQRMSNAQSNSYLSKTASHPLKFEQSNVGAIDSTSNIKSPAIAYSSATTPHFSSTNYQSMLNAHSNLYLSETASRSLKFEQSRIRAIKTDEEFSPFNSLFLPVTTLHSSSINDNGISPKVIEYVLECQKNADQSFVHRKDANSFMCNTDKYNPVDYAAITKNNQMSFEPLSIPNIQQISKPIRPNILLKSNRALRRYIPNVLTSRLQPIDKKEFQESVHVYNFRNTNEQIESTSNIKQNDFHQISYSTNQQSHSMDEEYSSNTFHSQLIPNPAFETPKNTLFGKYYMDISMFPKLKVYSDELNQSLILKNALEKPAKPAYRMCNPSSHNIPLTQFTPIGNSIKPGIPKLSAHEVGDELGICPVILHPSKQLSSQVQMKSEALIKTIGFAPARSQMTAQAQNRIVSTPLQRSIMESQNVSPLIITPTSHVIHSSNEIVPAKIVPIPTAPAVSHFSVINKTGSYDSIPEYTGIRQSLVSGTPPVYTQSDFARFPPKSYHHKNAVVNPAVIHGPIPGNIDEPCINIPNSQHVFKPIISPRPSILRKRDADGVLRAQKNLIPILTKPDPDECQNTDETSLNRNGYSETGLKLESIMVPQVPEVKLLPQISALTRQPHMMVEISPRKKPRKQLLPVNQEDSPFKIVGDDMEYVDEKLIKSEKSEDFPDEDLNCNDDLIDGDAEDEAEDDLDDMDVDDDCPADDDYDDDEDDFGDEFDYVKSEKPFFEDVKPAVEVSDESSAKPKNKRPSLLAGYKNTWRAFQTHHFHRHADFKIKETKKQLADMQQSKKWMSDSISGWRIQHLIDQFDEMVIIEDDIIVTMTQLKSEIEANINDHRLCSHIVELVEDNIQRSKVSRAQLDDIRHQLKKIFDYKTLIEDVVEKYCPKDLKKKYAKVFNLSKL